MTDRVIPSGGSTTDTTPEIRIRMNEPLWPGAEVRMLRNGEFVGLATILTPVELTFTDSVPPGQYEYRAEIKYDDRTAVSLPYFVMIVAPEVPDVGVPQATIINIIDLAYGEAVPTPSIVGIEGEVTPLPEELRDAPLMVLGSEEPVVLGQQVHWRKLVLDQFVTNLQIDTAQGAADTVIYLFGPGGNLIAYDDDGGTPIGTEYTSLIQLSSLTAGTYFLGVVGYPGGTTGPFELTVQNDFVAEEFILRLAYATP